MAHSHIHWVPSPALTLYPRPRAQERGERKEARGEGLYSLLR